MFIVVFLSLSGIFLIEKISVNTEQLYLKIQVDGKLFKTISLEQGKQSQVISIETPTGESLIEIEGKKVRMKSSNCRDQLCVKNGWLSRPNETSVCLPNRVSITLVGGSSNDVDIISY